MTGGRMHIPHPIPLVIKWGNHQKSLAYFSHLARLVLLFFTKRQSQKGGHGPMPPKYAPVLPVRRPAVEKRCISE